VLGTGQSGNPAPGARRYPSIWRLTWDNGDVVGTATPIRARRPVTAAELTAARAVPLDALAGPVVTAKGA